MNLRSKLVALAAALVVSQTSIAHPGHLEGKKSKKPPFTKGQQATSDVKKDLLAFDNGAAARAYWL
jgi:hypothetical protein